MWEWCFFQLTLSDSVLGAEMPDCLAKTLVFRKDFARLSARYSNRERGRKIGQLGGEKPKIRQRGRLDPGTRCVTKQGVQLEKSGADELLAPPRG
ncbi:MAG: hypothetical protein FWD31_12245 [Planctomycetaceae bacterium]|nr:hypothetical protein [Planctomycetaceae bacterium]